ncbi:unnamed protein product [Effrenium voratum]|uniref:Uncharacterized protein n=1 Tax=Effrenium voratum TaxID=2562239 RepID=A0AA36MML7_9DINO|nr:unnamed protein product [Effrenium voratum]
MHGPMCGACMPGFAKPIGQPLKLCERCPSMLWCILGVCVQLLVILGMSSFLMVVNALSDYSKPKNIFSIILKQFLNYLQMAGAVLSTGGAHGLYGGLSIVSGFEVVQDYLGFGSAGWMPVAGSCLIEQLLPGFGVHTVVTLVGLAWFPATAITSTLGFVLVRLVRRLMGWGGLDLRHLQTWLMVNFFLYLPRVNRLLIVNFGCQTFDTSRLTMDPRVSCWSQEHVVWQMLSWGGLFVFSVGGPLLLYMVLRRLYKSEVLGSYRVLKTYGFLFAGFEPSFYYFECIYMFRKLCFELVMTLPGMTSEDQAILGRINNSSVAFVASVFFGLHMACQPYDNRDYFILDRIETASLRAILITAFLQLWCLDTNDADGILHVPVLREVRNLFCTAAIVLLHLYFLWLVFYALARRRLQGWVATCTGRDFSQGSVVFVPDGLLLKNLNAREENLLETMFAQMVEVHAGSKRKIAFDSWAGGLQMLCLESQRSKVEAEIKSLDSVGLTLRSWRERAAKLFNHNRLGNLCERFIDRLEDAYGLLGHQNGNSLLQTRQKDLEDLKLFCAESLNKLLNHEFRVEELQDSMLCLGREIADYKRISGLGASDGEREGSESDEKPDLAFYVGEMELGDSAAVLVERSNAEEVKHLREEVQDRLVECHELRRQLATIRRDLTVNRNRSRTSLIAQGSIMSQMEDYEREEEDLETKLQEQAKEAQRLREELEAKLAAAEGTAAELEQKLEESKEEAAEARETAETKAEAKDFEIHSLQAELRKLLAASQVCWSCTTKLPAAAKFCFKCGQATTEVL